MLDEFMTDLKKACSNSRLYVGIFGLAFVMILNLIPDFLFNYPSYHPTLEGLLLQTNSTGMIMYMFVFSIAGGGFFFCAEAKSGNLRYVVGRSDVRTYARSKMCLSFLGGFFTIFIGMLLVVGALTGILAVFNHSFDGMVLEWHDLQNELLYDLFFCILGGVMSAIAFLVTTLIPDYFIAVIVPIIVHYVLLNVTGGLPQPFRHSRIFIYEGLPLWNSTALHFVYALLVAALLCWIMEQICIWRIERRLEHA